MDDKKTESLDLNSRIEISKYTYELVNGWIVSADNRVSICCALITGIFAVVSFVIKSMLPEEKSLMAPNAMFLFFELMSLVSLIAAIVLFVLAIYPNLGSVGSAKNKKCPVFFGDIAELSLEDYKEKMKGNNAEDFLEELNNEIYYNSRIFICLGVTVSSLEC